ncbi:MAG: hypothetical protein HQM02_04830 [Magnetococcales bacterium]|nr:hypothetical protein [Magnetococcales bacterium]
MQRLKCKACQREFTVAQKSGLRTKLYWILLVVFLAHAAQIGYFALTHSIQEALGLIPLAGVIKDNLSNGSDDFSRSK